MPILWNASMIGRRLGAVILLVALAAIAFSPRASSQPTFAPDLAIRPVFPPAVEVGRTGVAASLQLDASSLAPSVVSAVTLDPTCEDPTSAGGCGPGGSLVLSTTARGSGRACDGFTFVVVGPDAAGRYLFKPSSAIVLATGLAAACTIRFTFDALTRTPAGRVSPVAALTAFPLVPLLAGTATGSSVMTVVPAAPTVRVSASQSSAAVGTPIRSEVAVTAVVGPGTPGPTGTVTFELFGPDDDGCDGAPAFTSKPAPLSGGRVTSPTFAPRSAGIYRWVATYEGDLNYELTRTPCDDPTATTVVARASAAAQPSAPMTGAGSPPPTAAPPAVVAPPPGATPPGAGPGGSGSGDRSSALAPYDPLAHASDLVDQQVGAFVLLGVVLGAAGGRSAARARLQGGSGPQSGSQSLSGSDSSGGGEMISTQVGVPETGAVFLAAQSLERGDRSGTWQWPGTESLDRVSLTLPRRVARLSPLLARVMDDGGYLRAILGFASVLVPLGALALGLLAVLDVDGEPLPPAFGLLVAIAVLGVFDALAGLIAVAVFVTGVVVLGGLSSADAARTLLALALLWFAAPLIAGASRPLRREPTRTMEEHWDRLADIVIASLIGAWAVQQILQALPTLSGLELPVATRANDAALVVLVALAVRMVIETIAAHWYPSRLSSVQAPELPGPRTGQRLAAKMLTLAVFLFVATSYVGLCWQLYVGGVLFIVPQFLEFFADRFPNSRKLHTALPHGIVQIVLLLFVTGYLGVLAVDRFRDSLELIRWSFLLLSLPGFVFATLDLFGREGPEYPLRWRHQILGVLILSIGILFVLGVIGI